MLTILPSIVHGSCNGRLLQLSECIELLKSEVKKKMKHEVGEVGVRRLSKSHSTETLRGERPIFYPIAACARELSVVRDDGGRRSAFAVQPSKESREERQSSHSCLRSKLAHARSSSRGESANPEGGGAGNTEWNLGLKLNA